MVKLLLKHKLLKFSGIFRYADIINCRYEPNVLCDAITERILTTTVH